MKIYELFETALLERLNSVTTIQTKEWYNQQYERATVEKPFPRPAVYFELAPLVWKQLGNKVQSATAKLTLHHVVENYIDSPTEAFTLAQATYQSLTHEALITPDNTPITSPLVRTDSELIDRYTMLKVVKVQYEFELYDYSIVDPTTPVSPGFTINM
jgi:hypothetical protein